MSTKTLPPKRAPEEQVWALLLIAARDQKLRLPRTMAFYDEPPFVGNEMLVFTCRSAVQMRLWALFFDAVERLPELSSDGTTEFHASAHGWNGWSVALTAREKVAVAAPRRISRETADLIGKATADDAAGSPEADGGDARQCPSTWYGAPCTGEVAEGDVACDYHKTVAPEFVRVAVMDPGFGCEACPELATTHILRADVVVGTACAAHVTQVETKLLAGAAA